MRCSDLEPRRAVKHPAVTTDVYKLSQLSAAPAVCALARTRDRNASTAAITALSVLSDNCGEDVCDAIALLR